MVKQKVAELEGATLAYWVAKAEGRKARIQSGRWCIIEDLSARESERSYAPHCTWSEGGPIIEREKIATSYSEGGVFTLDYATGEKTEPSRPCWFARKRIASGEGETLLIAAMRCYVASRFGEEVPDA